jgi:hypothetical protein
MTTAQVPVVVSMSTVMIYLPKRCKSRARFARRFHVDHEQGASVVPVTGKTGLNVTI